MIKNIFFNKCSNVTFNAKFKICIFRALFQDKNTVLPVWATPCWRKDVLPVIFPLTWELPIYWQGKLRGHIHIEMGPDRPVRSLNFLLHPWTQVDFSAKDQGSFMALHLRTPVTRLYPAVLRGLCPLCVCSGPTHFFPGLRRRQTVRTSPRAARCWNTPGLEDGRWGNQGNSQSKLFLMYINISMGNNSLN